MCVLQDLLAHVRVNATHTCCSVPLLQTRASISATSVDRNDDGHVDMIGNHVYSIIILSSLAAYMEWKLLKHNVRSSVIK